MGLWTQSSVVVKYGLVEMEGGAVVLTGRITTGLFSQAAKGGDRA
jgi:hypothetical protein